MTSENTALKVSWMRSMPFIAVHFFALGIVLLTPFHFKYLLLAVGSYLLRMFAITAGFHRYFSHRAFKTSRPFQFILAFLGTAATQKGPLWWAANHRHHHKESDSENDTHSPHQGGFWWSHVGWFLCVKFDNTPPELVPDFAGFPELWFLNRNFWLPPVIYGLALGAIWGWPGVLWGYFVSTVLLWHGTFVVNSLAHLWGSKVYHLDDESRNNFWIALVTLGEGWHNNHHAYMSSANQGFRWWEIDPSFYVLKLLRFLGVVWDLRRPPLATLSARLHRRIEVR